MYKYYSFFFYICIHYNRICWLYLYAHLTEQPLTGAKQSHDSFRRWRKIQGRERAREWERTRFYLLWKLSWDCVIAALLHTRFAGICGSTSTSRVASCDLATWAFVYGRAAAVEVAVFRGFVLNVRVLDIYSLGLYPRCFQFLEFTESLQAQFCACIANIEIHYSGMLDI